MTVRCSGTVQDKLQNGHVRIKRCPKMARKFFRVRYDSVRGSDEGVYGFCEACARGKNTASNWHGRYARTTHLDTHPADKRVVHLPGNVLNLTVVEASEVNGNNVDKDLVRLKDRLLTIMRQKNTAKYRDKWEEIFADVVKQFTVEAVMKI